MPAFISLENHGSGEGVLGVAPTEDPSMCSVSTFNLSTKKWSNSITVPTVFASSGAINREASEIAIGGWESGKIHWFTNSGELLDSSNLKNLTSIAFTNRGTLTCTSGSTVFEWDLKRGMKKRFSVKGEIVINLGDYLLEDIDGICKVIAANSGEPVMSFDLSECGVNSVFLEGSRMIIAQSRGSVLAMDLAIRELMAEITSPPGCHPIYCGYSPREREIAVFHGDISSGAKGVLACYGEVGGLNWQGELSVSPAVATFASKVNAFLTGSRMALMPRHNNPIIDYF